MKRMLSAAIALAAVANLVQPAAWRARLSALWRPTQPDPTADVAPYFVSDSDPRWSSAEWTKEDIEALRRKIKYVFVIFNENRSFDHEYGTFPGANGLYSDGKAPRSAADTPGFTQTYLDTATGKTVTVQPFLVGPAQNASFKDFDRPFAQRPRREDRRQGRRRRKWTGSRKSSGAATPCAGSDEGEKQGTQFARLVMAHIDCDTIPFFWRYASRFTLFDNIFATEDTPSTPNAVAMIAGQSGETQWVKHPGSTVQPDRDRRSPA